MSTVHCTIELGWLDSHINTSPYQCWKGQCLIVPQCFTGRSSLSISFWSLSKQASKTAAWLETCSGRWTKCDAFLVQIYWLRQLTDCCYIYGFCIPLCVWHRHARDLSQWRYCHPLENWPCEWTESIVFCARGLWPPPPPLLLIGASTGLERP